MATRNDIEKLWDDLDRLREGIENAGDYTYQEKVGAKRTLDTVKQMLNVIRFKDAEMQKESGAGDLETEIRRYEDSIHGFCSSSWADCQRMCEYFAEWGHRHPEAFCMEDYEKEGVIDQDMEDAAKHYAKGCVLMKEWEKYTDYMENLPEGEEPKMKAPDPNEEYFLDMSIINAFKAGWLVYKDRLRKAKKKA